MMEPTPLSMESISSTDEWRSLTSSRKRILTRALESRNLLAAINLTYSSLDAAAINRVVGGLLADRAVQTVVILHALGVSLKSPWLVEDIPAPPIEEPIKAPEPSAPPV